MDPLKSVLNVAASGMRAQGERLKVVSENVANASSTGNTEGGDPYRRKVISFEELVDRETGASMVGVSDVTRDSADFELRFDPAHPAADQDGFVSRQEFAAPMDRAFARLDKDGDGFKVTKAHLTTKISGNGDRDEMLKLAGDAEKGCPISKLMNAEITLDATVA